MITEQQLSELFSLLQTYSIVISKRCLNALIPFVCQSVYPPCDGNGSAQFITQEQCLTIRDNVCEAEWRIAMTIASTMTTGLGSLLPDRETLSNDAESAVNNIEPPRCHHEFREFCGLCVALCATFSQYSNQDEIAERVVVIVASILVLTSGLIFLTISVIRRSEM